MAGKLAALIMRKMAPPEEEAEPKADDGLRSAMEAFVSAIKADDIEGAMSAFRSACELAESGPEEASEPE